MKSEPIGKTIPDSQTDWERVIAMSDNDIADDDDNPVTTEADWEGAIKSHSLEDMREKLAIRRRGPSTKPLKESTTIRFDPDVLAALRATGKGWQTRVNEVMREWVKGQKAESL